jgi:hypothetical protein
VSFDFRRSGFFIPPIEKRELIDSVEYSAIDCKRIAEGIMNFCGYRIEYGKWTKNSRKGGAGSLVPTLWKGL